VASQHVDPRVKNNPPGRRQSCHCPGPAGRALSRLATLRGLARAVCRFELPVAWPAHRQRAVAPAERGHVAGRQSLSGTVTAADEPALMLSARPPGPAAALSRAERTRGPGGGGPCSVAANHDASDSTSRYSCCIHCGRLLCKTRKDFTTCTAECAASTVRRETSSWVSSRNDGGECLYGDVVRSISCYRPSSQAYASDHS
jgi:hypothetical protein